MLGTAVAAAVLLVAVPVVLLGRRAGLAVGAVPAAVDTVDRMTFGAAVGFSASTARLLSVDVDRPPAERGAAVFVAFDDFAWLLWCAGPADTEEVADDAFDASVLSAAATPVDGPASDHPSSAAPMPAEAAPTCSQRRTGKFSTRDARC